ncbi:hypothetical protein VCRA2113O215_10266 [Vibrio crassostreae]|nr:hypothetical protein VCRA2113O231_10266 [Vibrio crassostreae]CAK1864990.1 hypothetical protein VCRA2112O191_10266 [Vibrio crassostreae]CAK1998774.1 hypothetical protein VCRA2113O218_20277 [Vibrio crassostreae]CAK1999491.1 hypothetical protein VCRA2113O224_20277 [Vibrio crassostreae]CAK2003248.1 hypothetical protein VCRA2112O184_20267 [Vibrio crassostreae]
MCIAISRLDMLSIQVCTWEMDVSSIVMAKALSKLHQFVSF